MTLVEKTTKQFVWSVAVIVMLVQVWLAAAVLSRLENSTSLADSDRASCAQPCVQHFAITLS